MKTLVASLVLGLVVTIVPGAASARPAHRLDVAIKLQGDSGWVGADVYGAARKQQVTGVLRETPGRFVAVVRVTNTGSRATALDVWASSIRGAFYGGARWPSTETLAPGESVTFRYVGHRGTARPGDSMPVDITVRSGRRVLDGVRLLLTARR